MTNTNDPPKPEGKKLPYTKPQLVVLGTVRELTGSGTGSIQELPGVPSPKP